MKLKNQIMGLLSLFIFAMSGVSLADYISVPEPARIQVIVPDLGALPGPRMSFKKSNGTMASGYISVDWDIYIADGYKTSGTQFEEITKYHPVVITLVQTNEPGNENKLYLKQPKGDGPYEIRMPSKTYELGPTGYNNAQLIKLHSSGMVFKVIGESGELMTMESGNSYGFGYNSPTVTPLKIEFVEDERNVPADQVTDLILPPEVCNGGNSGSDTSTSGGTTAGGEGL